MAITLNGTTGITTPDIDTDGLSVDTNAIFVDPATNNVGIGTSLPIAGFRVTMQSDAEETAMRVVPFNDTAKGAVYAGSNDGAAISGLNPVGGVIRFRTGTTATITERARIDAGGNLLVGTTSNPNGSVFNVFGATVATFENSQATSAFQIIFKNPNGNIGSITTSGTSTAYNTSSDYRLKENVAPMQNALATVAQLNPVTYNWKVDGSVGQGFIAHELQAVVPDCVTGEKNEVRTVDVHDDEGRLIGTKEEPQYQGVDTSFLVGILTAAIQEQQTLIQALTARIEALEVA